MMRQKRRLAAGIGVVAMVGMALWLRELASWRPVVVAKIDRGIAGFWISQDGRFLLVEDKYNPDNVISSDGWLIEIENGRIDRNYKHFRQLDDKKGRDFPRVWQNEYSWGRFLFWPAPEREKLTLKFKPQQDGFGTGLNGAWSRERSEVYGVFQGEILTWDWNTGHLKKQFKFGTGGELTIAFSPDARLLLAAPSKSNSRALNIYNVQTGRIIAEIDRDFGGRSARFSLDGRYLSFVKTQGNGRPLSLQVNRTSDPKIVWRVPCSGPVNWLTDHRVGIVQPDGFELRTESGQLIRRLPGPFQKSARTPQDVTDWTLSPDEKWIYSCEESGIIRRWRAK